MEHDDRAQKAILSVICGVFVFIFTVAAVALDCSVGQRSSAAAVCRYIVCGEDLDISAYPQERRDMIADYRRQVSSIDPAVINARQKIAPAELDEIRIKSMFFLLLVERSGDFNAEPEAFVDCFLVGNAPLTSDADVFSALKDKLGVILTAAEKDEYTQIYGYCTGINTYLLSPNGLHDEIGQLTEGDEHYIGGSFVPPIIGWQDLVTSEYEYRSDPIDGGIDEHTGLDIGAAIGTDIHAAAAGKVLLVYRLADGYGFHVVIDHGGGIATVYAHCSAILVSEGQTVGTGAVIAKVGNTGRVTGAHLHFEVVCNGQPVNPRLYLPKT